MTIKTIVNECVECNKDTSFGSGRFINRMPATRQESETSLLVSGYLCAECQQETCYKCKNKTIDYMFSDNCDVLCYDCDDGTLRQQYEN